MEYDLLIKKLKNVNIPSSSYIHTYQYKLHAVDGTVHKGEKRSMLTT